MLRLKGGDISIYHYLGLFSEDHRFLNLSGPWLFPLLVLLPTNHVLVVVEAWLRFWSRCHTNHALSIEVLLRFWIVYDIIIYQFKAFTKPFCCQLRNWVLESLDRKTSTLHQRLFRKCSFSNCIRRNVLLIVEHDWFFDLFFRFLVARSLLYNASKCTRCWYSLTDRS
jgi:hypothetical protein